MENKTIDELQKIPMFNRDVIDTGDDDDDDNDDKDFIPLDPKKEAEPLPPIPPGDRTYTEIQKQFPDKLI